jgi:peptide/nickel transport system substrate-binding protein
MRRRLAGLGLAALLCAACERGGDAPATRSARSEGVPGAQRLVDASLSDPKTFNPSLVTHNASHEALEPVFEGLVRLNPVTTEVEPLLAERWEVSDDGRTCTLHLRRDVRWHDGTRFTAADVAFCSRASSTAAASGSWRPVGSSS